MRPIRLEIEGFTAFRQKTIIDFDGVETFVLSGPTGSGKSSIIDAITFALYGSVPRYNDPKLIHPIVSQGLVEAKVRFDFQINGKTYTAVRVVKKQKKGESWGATTKEARLEVDEKVLAGNATELDQQIRALFGLDFDQFTSCVVLPQGEFAKFLNAQPNKRQDILKNLLRIHIYERIGQEARRKFAEEQNTKKVYEGQLSEYADLALIDKKTLTMRIARLEQLLKEAESTQKELTHLNAALSKHRETINDKEVQMELLKKVTPPKDYTAINDKYAKASSAHDTSVKAVSEAESNVERIEKKLANLESVSELQSFLADYEEKSEEEEGLTSLQKDLIKNEKLESQQSELVAKLNKELDSIGEELKNAENEHLAYHLSQKLSKGQKCPVCERPLTEKPQHAIPKDLKKKEVALTRAKEALEMAQAQLQATSAEMRALTKQVTNSKKKVEQLRKTLQSAPSLVDVKKGIQTFQKIEEELNSAREAEKKARKVEKDALLNKNSVLQELKVKWKTLDGVRDSIAVMKPPSMDKDNYKKSWDDLSSWASRKEKELKLEVSKITLELATLEGEIGNSFEPIRKKLKAEGVDIHDDDNIRDVIFENISHDKSELKRLDAGLKKLKELNSKIESLKKSIDTAKALAQHMNANFFERWLLQEAFDNLVTEASQKLKELTSGDYSFAIDDKLNFDIIDHKNADERRTSKTLSGGETFLASLALALTLSEQIAQLATEGSAPLDSIFLDEGFGTLDPETLDTVSAAIEELASKGRMIGIITHMKELADRIPIQYRVSKGITTAAVERIAL